VYLPLYERGSNWNPTINSFRQFWTLVPNFLICNAHATQKSWFIFTNNSWKTCCWIFLVLSPHGHIVSCNNWPVFFFLNMLVQPTPSPVYGNFGISRLLLCLRFINLGAIQSRSLRNSNAVSHEPNSEFIKYVNSNGEIDWKHVF